MNVNIIVLPITQTYFSFIFAYLFAMKMRVFFSRKGTITAVLIIQMCYLYSFIQLSAASSSAMLLLSRIKSALTFVVQLHLQRFLYFVRLFCMSCVVSKRVTGSSSSSWADAATARGSTSALARHIIDSRLRVPPWSIAQLTTTQTSLLFF